MNPAALAIFASYLTAIAVIAYFGAKKVRTVEDFVAASGQLGFWTYILLMVGSVFSGMSLIGVAGLAFTTGWANVWERIFGPAFAIAFGTIVIGYKLFPLKEKYKLVTIQDYLAFRYRDAKTIRLLAAVVSAITSYIYLIGQYTAIGIASEVILGIPYWLGVIMAALIVVAYVSSGGMFSTAWTTFAQSLLMIIGVFLTVPLIISHVGGIEHINSALASMPELQKAKGLEEDFMFAKYLNDPFAPANVPLAGWVYNLTLFGIAVPLGLMVAPHVVNNMLTFKKREYTRWGPLVMYLLGFSTIFLTSLAGIAARVAWAEGRIEIPEIKLGEISVKWSDMAYPTIASAFLPEWLFLFLLPTILAGVMSTTDRLIVTTASNITYDILAKAFGLNVNGRKFKVINAIIVFAVGLSSIYFALHPQQLLAWLIWASLSLMANCFFFPIILGLYWSGMTKNGARASMISGLLLTILTFAIHGKTVWIFGIPVYSVLPGFIASFLSGILVSVVEKRVCVARPVESPSLIGGRMAGGQ